MAPLLFFLLFLLSEAASETVVKVVQVEPVGPDVPVESGKDATLKCQTDGVKIIVAEWTRSDLRPPKDILFWRDGETYTSIEDRVQLVDGDLKNGDASLILKNVSRDDVGTYECRVLTAGSRRKKRANIDAEPISIVQLQMTEDQNGGDNVNKDNNGGIMDTILSHQRVGLAAAGVLLVCSAAVAVGLFLVSKSKRQRYKKPEPSAAEETGDNLI